MYGCPIKIQLAELRMLEYCSPRVCLTDLGTVNSSKEMLAVHSNLPPLRL